MKSVQSIRNSTALPMRSQGAAVVWILAVLGILNAAFAIAVVAYDYFDQADAGRSSTSAELWLGGLITSGLTSSVVLIWLSVQRLRRIRTGRNPAETLPSVAGDTTELPRQTQAPRLGSGAFSWLGALLTGKRRRAGSDDPGPGLSVHSQAVLQSLASPLLLRRPETPDGCAVMLVGVDEFEHLLKAHGRKTTENTLREVGTALTRSVRASDVVGRVGYDGFAIVLAVGDRDVVMRAAGRIRDAIRRTSIPLPNNGLLSLSGSVGVAICHSDDGIESAFERAHAALKEAFAAGRGEVRLAEDGPAHPGNDGPAEDGPAHSGDDGPAADPQTLR